MRNFLSTPQRRMSVWDFMNEMDKVFDQSWGAADNALPSQREFAPQVDIEETDDFYLFSVDLPGVKREDVKVDVSDGVLRISGQRNFERKVEDKQFYRFERQHGSFDRSFRLPTKVDESKIQAQFEDGVLEVMVPKSEVSKPRSVQIESGKGGLFSKLMGAKKVENQPKDSEAH